MDGALVIKIIIGIGVTVVGGKVGLRKLMLMTIAGIGGFLAIGGVRELNVKLVSWFANIIPQVYAQIISPLLLMLTPLIFTYLLGRKALVKLSIDSDIDSVIDAILGCGFALSGYLVVLTIISRR